MGEGTEKANRGSRLDKAMAVLASLSVAFAGSTAPASVSGIAMASTQAGRVALALLAAAATFLGVSALLAALGTVRRVRGGAGGLPRVRRADMHPDAPVPIPILAARDLGAPLDAMPLDPPEAIPIAPEETSGDAERDHDLPGFLAAEAEAATEERAPAPTRPDLPFWMPEDAIDEAAPEQADDEDHIIPLRPAVRADLGDPPPENGVENLLQRLQSGLVRRGDDPGEADQPARVQTDAELEERLRSAMENLKKMARG